MGTLIFFEKLKCFELAGLNRDRGHGRVFTLATIIGSHFTIFMFSRTSYPNQ